MTRLSDDWDPYLMIGDGTYFVGGVISEDDGGEVLAADVETRPYPTPGSANLAGSLATAAPVPVVGGTVEAEIWFELTSTSTTVSMLVQGQLSLLTYTSLRTFDLNEAIYFALISDSNEGEIYQINSLTGPIPPVPLPAGVWLLLSALGGLGFAGWRRKVATS